MQLLAAGVAFYAFLAIFPALIAIVSIYGLFADPATITQPAELDDRRTARTGQAGHHRSGHHVGLAALDPWYRPHHLGRDRVVERLGRDQQPADRDQCRLRRGRNAASSRSG